MYVVWNAVLFFSPFETGVMYEKSVKKRIVCILYPEILREMIK
jgi:hypothetical protein